MSQVARRSETIDEAPSVIVRSPTFDEKAHQTFILPNRMGYRWRHFNHRIAIWKFGLARNGKGHPWADALRAHSVGGPFSNGLGTNEWPQVKYGYQRVDAASIENLGAARRRLDVVLGPDGSFKGTWRFGRRQLNLTGYRDIVPVVTGFGFDTSIPQSSLFPRTYHPGHGYLTRGLGGGIEVVDVDDESVEVEFWLRYGFGAAMDRPNHNEALLDAKVGAELDIALIGVTDVPVHRGGVHYSIDCDEPKIGVEQEIPPPPVEAQTIELDGEPGAPAGFFGVQAFNFDLTPRRSCAWNQNWPYGEELRGEQPEHPRYGRPGYYIRELTLDLRQADYDAETGRGEFLFNGYASNATWSLPFHPLHYDFDGRMVWFQADGSSRSVDFSSEFRTGASEFSLLDME